MKYTFILVVNNGTVDSSPDEIMVTVKNVREKPVAQAGFDQIVHSGEVVTLDGSSSSSSENPTLLYEWKSLSGIDLSSTKSSKPTFRASEYNKHTTLLFTLVVNDSYNTSGIDTVAVTVIKEDNLIPVAKAGADIEVNEGDTVWLYGIDSYDPDGDSLNFYWTSSIWDEKNISLEEREQIPLSPIQQINYGLSGLETKEIFAMEGTRVFICFSAATDNSHHILKFTDKKLENLLIMFYSTMGSCINFIAPPAGTYEYVVDDLEIGYLYVESVLNSINSPNPYFIAPEVQHDSIITFALTVFDGGEFSEPDQVEILIKNNIDVKSPITLLPGFKIFPNPTTGMFTIQLQNADYRKSEIAIFDLLGNRIYQQHYYSSGEYQVDLSEEPGGIYLIHCTSENKKCIKKLVINKMQKN
ncbi:MAG: T9SS type A sorting domain-containing protein [Mariniphaga sp.]|nr:T9SS type A sorting domain-containing protein [Mariniphaga sp.]